MHPIHCQREQHSVRSRNCTACSLMEGEETQFDAYFAVQLASLTEEPERRSLKDQPPMEVHFINLFDS